MSPFVDSGGGGAKDVESGVRVAEGTPVKAQVRRGGDTSAVGRSVKVLPTLDVTPMYIPPSPEKVRDEGSSAGDKARRWSDKGPPTPLGLLGKE
jgi:hypothetical protein